MRLATDSVLGHFRQSLFPTFTKQTDNYEKYQTLYNHAAGAMYCQHKGAGAVVSISARSLHVLCKY
jgi:hypothetical protein